MATSKNSASGDDPKPRKAAPKKAAAAKAPAKPRAPRAAKPKAAGAPAKPRAPRKKPVEAVDQLAFDLAAVPEVEQRRKAPARKRTASQTAPEAATPRATAKATATPARAARPRADQARTQLAPAPRPAPMPAVRVTLPRKVRLRDIAAALPALRRERKPRQPMPIVERMVGWLRNAATVAVVLLSLLVMWGASYALANPGHTPLMRIRHWQGLDGGRQLHTWKPFEELGDTTLLAIVAATDPAFLEEGGLHPDALKESMKQGPGALHATTLGKRVARELFSWPSESLLPRASAAFFSLVVEVSWSKRRILEVFANMAEFGPGLYGAEAAAQASFQVPASQLSQQQAALLAASLADPLHSNPAAPDQALADRANAILDLMPRLGGTAKLREALPAPKAEKD